MSYLYSFTDYIRTHLFTFFFFLIVRPPPRSSLFPHTTLFRSRVQDRVAQSPVRRRAVPGGGDRRGRHSARRVHDGSPAGGAAQQPAIRAPRGGAQPLSLRG